jgi:hypothetical protein
MGDSKDHLRKFSELSQRIFALGESIRTSRKGFEIPMGR